MLIMASIPLGVVAVLASSIALSTTTTTATARPGVYRVIKNKVNQIYKLYMKANKKGSKHIIAPP